MGTDWLRTRLASLSRETAALLDNRVAMALLALATIAVIGWLDSMYGTQLSFTALYLLPVAVIAWSFGRASGRLSSLIAGMVKIAAYFFPVATSATALEIVWNAGTIIVLAAIVGEVLTRLHAALEAEHDLARTDALTGLPNMRSFHELAVLELERARRYHRTFTVAVLDLDHFKDVNDTLGHHVGDRLLAEVGQALRSNLRRVDVVARLGGDEFTLLLPETDCAQSMVALGHVREALDRLTDGYGSQVKASIGAVTFRAAPETVGDMVRLADTAMYRAKAAGRDRVESVTMPEDATMLEELEITALHEFLPDAETHGSRR